MTRSLYITYLPEVPASSQAITGGTLGSIPRFSQCTGTHRTASSEGGSGEFVNTFPRHTNSADGGDALQAYKGRFP